MEYPKMDQSPAKEFSVASAGYVVSMLRRYRLLIISLPLSTVMLAVVYLLFTPAIFVSNAVIQIGQVAYNGKTGVLEPPAVMVLRLNEHYRVGEITRDQKFPKVTKIIEEKFDGGSMVKITVQDYSAKGAQVYLSQILDDVFMEHTRLYQQVFNIQNERLRALNSDLKLVNDLLSDFFKSSHLERRQDPSLASLLAIEARGLVSEKMELEQQKFDLHVNMDDVRAYPTRLLRQPTLSESRLKPMPGAILFFALVLGVSLAIFVVLITDFIRRAVTRSVIRVNAAPTDVA